MKIDVGIPTAGAPQVHRKGDYNIVENQLIGCGFHWERSIRTQLAGELLPGPDDTFTLINRLPLETYLECVVGSEMNPHAPIEFLKAHAVISRSWAMSMILRNKEVRVDNADEDHTYNNWKIHTPAKVISWEDADSHHDFDVCSDDHCQRYQGIQPISDEARIAIQSTAGEVLADPHSNIVDARFSKCCGGQTELFSTCWQGMEKPCLESFEDPWCNLSGLPGNKRKELLSSILKDYDSSTGGGYRWESKISAADVKRNLKRLLGIDVGDIISLTPKEIGASGRIKILTVEGTLGNVEVGKELLIRRLLSHSCLYSSAFEVKKKDNRFYFRGKGWGHGVGLCQIGAANMAINGFSYRDILNFYYPGAVLIETGS